MSLSVGVVWATVGPYNILLSPSTKLKPTTTTNTVNKGLKPHLTLYTSLLH